MLIFHSHIIDNINLGRQELVNRVMFLPISMERANDEGGDRGNMNIPFTLSMP